jgi:hypothetical protein
LRLGSKPAFEATRYAFSQNLLGKRWSGTKIYMGNERRVPHICPVLADVGFHGCPPISLHWQQVLMSMVNYIRCALGREKFRPNPGLLA